MLLVSVGVYRVISYLISQSTHDIGVRIALGAQPANILAFVVRKGMELAAACRYFGETQGKAWVQQMRQTLAWMFRIRVRPEWVGILDFQSRLPSALSS